MAEQNKNSKNIKQNKSIVANLKVVLDRSIVTKYMNDMRKANEKKTHEKQQQQSVNKGNSMCIYIFMDIKSLVLSC